MTSHAAALDPYFLTDPEIEEMEAPVEHVVSDEDWAFYFEATHVDPMEV
jgi:hypothetical protein